MTTQADVKPPEEEEEPKPEIKPEDTPLPPSPTRPTPSGFGTAGFGQSGTSGFRPGKPDPGKPDPGKPDKEEKLEFTIPEGSWDAPRRPDKSVAPGRFKMSTREPGWKKFLRDEREKRRAAAKKAFRDGLHQFRIHRQKMEDLNTVPAPMKEDKPDKPTLPAPVPLRPRPPKVEPEEKKEEKLEMPKLEPGTPSPKKPKREPKREPKPEPKPEPSSRGRAERSSGATVKGETRVNPTQQVTVAPRLVTGGGGGAGIGMLASKIEELLRKQKTSKARTKQSKAFSGAKKQYRSYRKQVVARVKAQNSEIKKREMDRIKKLPVKARKQAKAQLRAKLKARLSLLTSKLPTKVQTPAQLRELMGRMRTLKV